VTRLVLDLLKPHQPDAVTFTRRLAALDSVETVTLRRVETDREVETVEAEVRGAALDPEAVEARVTDLGASVHSVDEVACGEP
jgi:hypothetical protein